MADFVPSSVLELIFSSEKEGLDFIFSGVVISMFLIELRLASTDDRMFRAQGGEPIGSFADSLFARSQFMSPPAEIKIKYTLLSTHQQKSNTPINIFQPLPTPIIRYNYYMITEPQLKPSKSKKKKPVVVEPEVIKDKAYFMGKCEAMTAATAGKIADKIQNGDLEVSPDPFHLEYPKKDSGLGEQKDIREKINLLNQDYESLQQQIAIRKEQDRQRELSKRKQAKELINRLQKEKQEHQNRVKFNQIANRLKDSAFSEDVLKVMREHREKLVTERKMQMELKIYQNLNKRVIRQQESAKNEISYWVKVQELESQKRYHSTKVLPRIQTTEKNPKLGLGLQNNHLVLPRKNALSLHRKSQSKQDLLEYPDIIQRFIERAKAKKESQSERSPRAIAHSRLTSNQVISEHQNESQANGLPLKNYHILAAHHSGSKRKALGDSYLKESLLLVKPVSRLSENNVEESLQIKANTAIFSRNNKLTDLEERRRKVLNNLLDGKIQKPLALQMLYPLDSKLDRIDAGGIEGRLRQKLEIFEEHQKKHSKHIVLQQKAEPDPWEESSEHGI